VADAANLHTALQRQLGMDGPTLLRIVIKTGSRKDLARPELGPRDGFARFRAFLAGERWTGRLGTEAR
jgi:hypothetical protein